ncbi:DMT family transporter [Actinomycetospora sp. TBRC 11914]|uniref:DMT family transporter n=1 Tax=Actinomycetospora sp. TBRC 11914 TaxID=2729387 RepID=UPI00145DE99B|nr:DMT family transporter [Actinomycetospora sp. TBRC 11914]NMO92752.1 DMT family transporter [Actinomycetospora sp. TBRC 11914]
MSGSLPAALCAVAAASVLGTATVAQRRGMDGDGSGHLVAGLVRSRWWWAGTAASVGGLGLQFLALAIGPLIVVQTVMAVSIVVTALAEAVLLRRRPTPRRWAGMALTAAGLAVVLLALAPSASSLVVVPSATSIIAVTAGALVVAAVAAWHARVAAAGGLALAAATGLGYGVTAIAQKTVGAELAHGPVAVLVHPALWAALTVGPLSVLLSQHALRRARSVATAVSVIVVIDPLVGLLAGTVWFGEHVVLTPWSASAAVAAGVAVVMGIVLSHTEGRPPETGRGSSGGVPAPGWAARAVA